VIIETGCGGSCSCSILRLLRPKCSNQPGGGAPKSIKLQFHFVACSAASRSCNRVAHESAILGSVYDPDEDHVLDCILAEGLALSN
jgi:hypothetical protein